MPRAYFLKNYEIFSPFRRGPEIIILFVVTAEYSSMVLDLNHVMPQFFEGDQHGGAQALRSQCYAGSRLRWCFIVALGNCE
jgi:hypothetical protein